MEKVIKPLGFYKNKDITTTTVFMWKDYDIVFKIKQ